MSYATDRLLNSYRTEIETLCRRHKTQRLEIFGSAALRQDRPEESDLDFLVEFEPLAPGSYADTYFGLLEDLEQLFQRLWIWSSPQRFAIPTSATM